MARRGLKPTVNVKPGADHYAAPMERIIEFSTATGPGGLISIHDKGDGTVSVHVYRHDAGVHVTAGKPGDTWGPPESDADKARPR